MTELSPCAAIARRHDRERFLCALFAPGDRRDDLFALYAFNHEVAKTREVVREPLLGQIRLQWWRDAIAEIYTGQPRHHEVVDPLAAAVRRHGLARPDFERLIDAREQDLNADPPATMAALEAYADATSGGLNKLALTVLGAGRAASRDAGRSIGIAWALIGLMRAMAIHVRQRRHFIPRELIERHGVDLTEVMELTCGAGLRRALSAIGAVARARLDAARRLRRHVDPHARAVLLAAVLADRHLVRLDRVDHDPFDPLLLKPMPLISWRLAWSALRGRY